MKLRYILVSLFLSSLSAKADRLTDVGIKTSITPGVYKVRAGDRVEIPMRLTVAHPEKAAHGYAELNFWGFKLGNDGAAYLETSFQIIDQGSLLPFSGRLVFQTTEAMGGDYSLKGHSGDGGVWNEVLSFGDGVIVRIENSPDKIDTDGPITQDIAINPVFYLGERIKINAEITDTSRLCLDSTTSPYCPIQVVTAFVCEGQEGGVCLDEDPSGYVTYGLLTFVGNGRYEIALYNSPPRPGKYGVDLANFTDVWGNRRTGASKKVFFEVKP